MKKSIALLHILEHLISEEELQDTLRSHYYQDVGRAYELPSVHYSTLSKKASQVPYAIFKFFFFYFFLDVIAVSVAPQHF